MTNPHTSQQGAVGLMDGKQVDYFFVMLTVAVAPLYPAIDPVQLV